jgi:hypothetical protein
MRQTCRWNLGTTYRRQALFVCEGSPASPYSRQGTLVTSRMEVRSALGPAITRAGGIKPKEGRTMMKIAFVLATAAAAVMLTTAPLATPAKAQELKMAQGVDVQIGRDRSDRYDRDRRRNDATVGIGPGGVTIGPRQRCRMVTTTIERGDRTITRRERRCD